MLNEYLKEQNRYKLYSVSQRTWGYLNLILFLFLLFFTIDLNPKFYFLWVYSLYSNLSIFVIIYTFRIPKILIEFGKTNSDKIYNFIDENRNSIYLKFLNETVGRNFTENDLTENREKMMKRINSYLKFNWKTFFIFYYIFYFLLSILLFTFLFYDFIEIKFK